MKKWLILIVMLFSLAGCRSLPFDGGQSVIIDWIDFIKWDGKEYNGIHEGILADPDFVGEKIGTVKFKVADNVTNPEYKIKNGDAAFHEKGTEIFTIKDASNLIAIKSTDSINGYRVYFPREDMEYEWHFKDMQVDKVNKIEIYETYTSKGHRLINQLTNSEEVNHILRLLTDSEENPSFQPNSEKGDPIYYEMIFYTGEPVAYKYGLFFDGETYFWHPWKTAVVSNDISAYFP